MDLVAILVQGTVAIFIGVVTLVALLAFDASRRRAHPPPRVDARDRPIAVMGVFALEGARRPRPSAPVDAGDGPIVDPTALPDVRRDDARLGSDPAAARRRALELARIDDLQARLIRTQRGGSWTNN